MNENAENYPPELQLTFETKVSSSKIMSGVIHLENLYVVVNILHLPVILQI